MIRRTRQSSPASSKIASAKSAQVQSPSAATCQTPCGSAARSDASPRRGGRRRSGQPRWSSTTATSSRSSPSRSIVRTKLWPVGAEEPRGADDPRSLARGRLAVELRPPVGGRAGSARPTRRTAPALAPVEDVVGRVVDERRAERGDVRRPADVDAAAPCGSASAPSTFVHAAACRTRSGGSSPAGGGSATSQSARVSAVTPSGRTPRRARGRAGRRRP